MVGLPTESSDFQNGNHGSQFNCVGFLEECLEVHPCY